MITNLKRNAWLPVLVWVLGCGQGQAWYVDIYGNFHFEDGDEVWFAPHFSPGGNWPGGTPYEGQGYQATLYHQQYLHNAATWITGIMDPLSAVHFQTTNYFDPGLQQWVVRTNYLGTADDNLHSGFVRDRLNEHLLTNSYMFTLISNVHEIAQMQEDYAEQVREIMPLFTLAVNTMHGPGVVGSLNGAVSTGSFVTNLVISNATSLTNFVHTNLPAMTNVWTNYSSLTNMQGMWTNLAVLATQSMVFTNLNWAAKAFTNEEPSIEWSVQQSELLKWKLLGLHTTNGVWTTGNQLTNNLGATNETRSWADKIEDWARQKTIDGAMTVWPSLQQSTQLMLNVSLRTNTFTNMAEFDVGTFTPAANSQALTVGLPGYTLNFDPRQYGAKYWQYSSVVRNLCEMALVALFLWFVTKEAGWVILKQGAAEQSGFPNIRVFGVSVGWVMVPLFMVLSLGLIMSPLVFAWGIANGHWLAGTGIQVFANPLSLLAWSSEAEALLARVDDIFPINLAVSLIFGVFAIRWLLLGMFSMIVQTVRVLPAKA